MGKLVASIIEDCDGSLIELKLGQKVIETLYIRFQPYSNCRFQVERTIEHAVSLGDLQSLCIIDDLDKETPKRLIAESELDNTEIIRIKFETEILFKGTELQCIRAAKKWLEKEYSV